MTALIVPGDRHTALDVAHNLRPADAAELEANGRSPAMGILRCCELSTILRAIVALDGTPVAIFGFAPVSDDTACPWLLATPHLSTRHRRWFIENSAGIVALGDGVWSSYFNRVDARNTLHVRWLRWVGFDVRPPAPHGPLGLPFHPFYRTAPCAMSPPPSSLEAWP